MLQVTGINIDSMPFDGLELVNELLSFEGSPVLVHYIDSRKNDIIAYWVDFDNEGHRWLYTKVTKQLLYYYLIGSKSLNELFSELTTDFVFLIDYDLDNTVSSVKMIHSFSIPEKYFAKKDSFYLEGLSKYYSEYLTKYDYIHKMKENSCIFYVESTNDVHSKTVGAREAAIVLNGASNSMEGYIRVTAFNSYKNEFGNSSKINRRIINLKNRLSPRITQTADHSFEVWLAMDTITFYGEDKLDSDLRNTLVEGYKRDVLDVDFRSEEEAKLIADKYNEDERKLIFEPLIKLFENDSFYISISDNLNTIKRKQKKIKSAPAFKDTLFPKPTLKQIEEELNRKNLIYSIIVNLKEGDDITKISKKELLDNLLFAEQVAETPYEIKSPIEIDSQRVELKKSLKCVLRVDGEGNLQLYNSTLDIYSQGTDMQEVLNNIKREFMLLVKNYSNYPGSTDLKFEELSKYI